MPKQNNNKKGAAMEKKLQRRADAEARQAARDARSVDEQLELLDLRPGESKRERARLLKMKEAG